LYCSVKLKIKKRSEKPLVECSWTKLFTSEKGQFRSLWKYIK